jgi:hypothetical protein
LADCIEDAPAIDFGAIDGTRRARMSRIDYLENRIANLEAKETQP